jgi:hypothetical protein
LTSAPGEDALAGYYKSSSILSWTCEANLSAIGFSFLTFSLQETTKQTTNPI